MLFLPNYILNILLLPFLLPSFVLSSPHPSAVPTKPSHAHHSRKFTLKSQVISPPNPAFDNLDLEPYHIYPAFNYAVLVSGQKGIVGYLNGTRQELADQTGDLLFDGGSNIVYSFIIDSVNTTYNPIEINAGVGTKGIFIDQGVIKYNNPISGGFYACKETLLYGPAVQVFYKPKVITTPTGCSDVALKVEYV